MDVNTNISDYTIDELFSLLDIKINVESTYEELVSKIKKNSDIYISNFKKLNKPSIVKFFEDVESLLLYSSMQDPKKDNVVITYKKDYAHGGDSHFDFGNVLNRKTVNKMYSMDSRYRDNYDLSTSTNFSVTIPEEQRQVTEIMLCSMELPTTYYVFNNAHVNNYMWMKIVMINTSVIYLYIVLPQGNYSYAGFINTINSEIHNYAILQNITAGVGLTNAYGKIEGNGLVTFSFVDTAINTIEINFNAPTIPNQTSTILISTSTIPNTIQYPDTTVIDYYSFISPIPLIQRIGWAMGFRNGLYNTNSSIVSESVLDVHGPRYLFLTIDEHRLNVNSDFKIANAKNTIPNLIFAKIAIIEPPFSIQTVSDYSLYTEPRIYYGPVNISKVDIKLLDEHGRIMDLNSKNFSFTLRFTVIYNAT